jgi:hypothetical protein
MVQDFLELKQRRLGLYNPYSQIPLWEGLWTKYYTRPNHRPRYLWIPPPSLYSGQSRKLVDLLKYDSVLRELLQTTPQRN